ncbi:GNAT family N-acetyltransferase [Halobacillus shinanisalinarum]|uniref:GNAT family N-acetyltransferase n=1 Tax=Halobacillus shinanisalinarum TaxID=2932258 RepID=A0ABY4H592_9BACI|nr:GNAT family N-acetyltransferase [Halobacillus shinanisalinarum]UOQ95294.1 GNAT family N-acetyltransferase [Halobacillus shinanisalinarum]
MGHVSLLKPTVNLEVEYLSFYQEWKESGEEMIPWVIGKDPSDFGAMVESLLQSEKGMNLPEGWVPDSTFWLVDRDQIVLGVVNVRHQLTEKLSNLGGHIGYGIRPSARRKGYAAELLALTLEKVKELGIFKVLIVCDQGNIASKKTIRRNGGVEGDDFVEKSGNTVKRFWIEV